MLALTDRLIAASLLGDSAPRSPHCGGLSEADICVVMASICNRHVVDLGGRSILSCLLADWCRQHYVKKRARLVVLADRDLWLVFPRFCEVIKDTIFRSARAPFGHVLSTEKAAGYGERKGQQTRTGFEPICDREGKSRGDG